MFKQIFYIFIFCVFSEFLLAEVIVKSIVSPQVVSLKGILNLKVSIEYSSQKNIINPKLPKLKFFHVLGQHQSYQMQYINGSVSKKKQFTYMLRPLKAGKLTINPIEIIVDGTVYKTEPVEVEVSATLKPQARPHGMLNPFGNIGGGLGSLFQPAFFDQQILDKEDLLLKLETKKSIFYIGEMILAKWFFYVSYNKTINIQSEVIQNPKFDGFWVETIPPVKNRSIVNSKLYFMNQKKYKRQLFTSSALFAVRTGKLNIGDMKVKTHRVGSSIFNSVKVLFQTSNKKILKILPLPKKGKGAFFTQAVGDFDISATINKYKIEFEKPIIYTVHFKGQGHPRLITMPKLNFGDNLKIYDITESQKFVVSKSTKTFKIILIPKVGGDIIIPSFELTSFEPYLGIYKTHVLPSFKVHVVGSKKILFKNNKTLKKDTQKIKTGDLSSSDKKHFIKPWKENKNIQIWLKYRSLFWIFIYSLLFLFIGFIIGKKIYFRKSKKLLDFLLAQHLKQVDKAIKKQNWRQAGIILNRIMYLFFAELSKSTSIVKNWDNLFHTIPPSIKIKYETESKKLIYLLEKLSFASQQESRLLRNKNSVESLKQSLITLLKKIDKE